MLFKVTETPLAGAGALNVTVPVEELPAVTVAGVTDRPEIWPVVGAADPIVSGAVRLLAEVAVIVMTELTAVGDAVIVKVPLVWPAGIVMVAGIVAVVPPPLKVTITPPAGAGLVSVICPVAVPPAGTVPGVIENDPRVAVTGPTGPPFTVRVPCPARGPDVAETTTTRSRSIGAVSTWKLTEVSPEGMVTVAGTTKPG